jgi:hypothetical protein
MGHVPTQPSTHRVVVALALLLVGVLGVGVVTALGRSGDSGGSPRAVPSASFTPGATTPPTTEPPASEPPAPVPTTAPPTTVPASPPATVDGNGSGDGSGSGSGDGSGGAPDMPNTGAPRALSLLAATAAAGAIALRRSAF